MKRKLLSVLLAGCFLVPGALAMSACGEKDEIWNGKIANVSAAVENVITIETAEELAGFAKSVNDGNTYEGITIKLTCDMDLRNKEWTPIGYGSCNYVGELEEGHYFKGVFDGQNHTIENLKITKFSKGGIGDSTKASGVGLFGNIYEAEIKNLKIDDANVKGNHYVGALVGFSVDSDITNCHVEDAKVDCFYANEDESGDKAGAVVGHFAKGIYNESAASISNCSAEDSVVKADRDAGQVIGSLSNGATNVNNTVDDVSVSWNESSVGVVEGTYNKANTNIKNEIVGRVS